MQVPWTRLLGGPGACSPGKNIKILRSSNYWKYIEMANLTITSSFCIKLNLLRFHHISLSVFFKLTPLQPANCNLIGKYESFMKDCVLGLLLVSCCRVNGKLDNLKPDYYL